VVFGLCVKFTGTVVKHSAYVIFLHRLMFFPFWFRILVPDYGFMHLELIPMLIGFFTYKIAMFAQAIQESFPVAGNREV
jgi:hypothetical protein